MGSYGDESVMKELGGAVERRRGITAREDFWLTCGTPDEFDAKGQALTNLDSGASAVRDVRATRLSRYAK